MHIKRTEFKGDSKDHCIYYLNLYCAEMRGFNDLLIGVWNTTIIFQNNNYLTCPTFRNILNCLERRRRSGSQDDYLSKPSTQGRNAGQGRKHVKAID